MLEVRKLTIEVAHKKVIENLSFNLNKGDKLAIIGEEGNGKTTLLKAIYDKSLIDYGEVTGIVDKKNNKIGYLKQTLSVAELDMKIFEYLYSNMDEYYMSIGKLYKVLNAIGFNVDVFENRKLNTLSGGEKIKMQFLKLLLGDYDIYFLDEPTNDLDIDSLIWLQNFIKHTLKPIVYVSHDELLLEETANMIMHLELIKKKSVFKYSVCHMKYLEYVENRLHLITKNTSVALKERQNKKIKEDKLNQIMNKVDHELNTISRKDPKGAKLLKKKMKSLKSQEKRFEKEEIKEIPEYEKNIMFTFEKVFIPPSKIVIDFRLDKLNFGEKILSHDIKLLVKGQEKIVILGQNGCGKTTLIKKIYEQLKNREDITTFYMPQNYDEIFETYDKPLDFLCETFEKEEQELYRSYMGNMNFTIYEMNGKINELSGGSKTKLILLKQIISKCNVLILDEPTRNTSPLSNPIIRKALSSYEGTIISVSHDRKYISEVANKIYYLSEDGLKYEK